MIRHFPCKKDHLDQYHFAKSIVKTMRCTFLCTGNLIKRKNVPKPRHKIGIFSINSNNTYEKFQAKKEKKVVL